MSDSMSFSVHLKLYNYHEICSLSHLALSYEWSVKDKKTSGIPAFYCFKDIGISCYCRIFRGNLRKEEFKFKAETRKSSPLDMIWGSTFSSKGHDWCQRYIKHVAFKDPVRKLKHKVLICLFLWITLGYAQD